MVVNEVINIPLTNILCLSPTTEEVRQEAKPDVIYRTRYYIPGILSIELHTLAYWDVRFSFIPRRSIYVTYIQTKLS